MIDTAKLPLADDPPAHVLDAAQHPENYYTCVCGDGPWHKLWVSPRAWEHAELRRERGEKTPLLGGCCSGGD